MSTIVQSIDEMNRSNLPFKVGDAVNFNEALSKGQLPSELKEISSISKVITASTVDVKVGMTQEVLPLDLLVTETTTDPITNKTTTKQVTNPLIAKDKTERVIADAIVKAATPKILSNYTKRL